VLARIDDRDFRTALNQAKADVAASEAAVKNLNAQIELQEPLIQQQAAEVDAAEANLKFAREEQARYDGLMKSGSGTVQRAQQTDAALRAQTAQLQRGKEGLIAANKRSVPLDPARRRLLNSIPRARSGQATLNLSYTRLPHRSTALSVRSLRVGHMCRLARS
jgi:membrane fusion protein (multidrug efflux system)